MSRHGCYRDNVPFAQPLIAFTPQGINGKNPRHDFRVNVFFKGAFCNTVLLCLYLVDPATLLASASVLGTLFSFENIYGFNKYF